MGSAIEVDVVEARGGVAGRVGGGLFSACASLGLTN